MAKRKHRGQRERDRLFILHGGRCHMCNGKIWPAREDWELSHVIEWKLTEDDSDENVKPAHKKCHRDYTNKVGNPMLADTERKRAKHNGTYPKSRFKLASRPFQSGRVARNPPERA